MEQQVKDCRDCFCGRVFSGNGEFYPVWKIRCLAYGNGMEIISPEITSRDIDDLTRPFELPQKCPLKEDAILITLSKT